MDPSAIAGLCALLARGTIAGPLPQGLHCPGVSTAQPSRIQSAGALSSSANVVAAIEAPQARDGIARVAFAEAGDQGDSGLAGVIYAILNRLAGGRWGTSINPVLDARSQFEPVMRAGGDWHDLPAVSAAQQARVDTILNLALDGRLPDLTGGARYFQNPALVARRARAGEVSPGSVDFGGAIPSAIIGAHSFYVEPGRGGASKEMRRRAVPRGSEQAIFVGENRAPAEANSPETVADPSIGSAAPTPPFVDPAQALFIGHDGLPTSGHP